VFLSVWGQPVAGPGVTRDRADLAGHRVAGIAACFAFGSAVLPGSAYTTFGRVHARRARHVDATFARWPAIEARSDWSWAPAEFGATSRRQELRPDATDSLSRVRFRSRQYEPVNWGRSTSASSSAAPTSNQDSTTARIVKISRQEYGPRPGIMLR
jgi:hypothetical protein